MMAPDRTCGLSLSRLYFLMRAEGRPLDRRAWSGGPGSRRGRGDRGGDPDCATE